MSRWNKDFLFSFENIAKRETQKLHAWKLANRIFCSEEHFVVRSLLDECVMFFCSQVSGEH